MEMPNKNSPNQQFSPEDLVNINYRDIDPSLKREEILTQHSNNVIELKTIDQAIEYDVKMFEKTIIVPEDAPESVKHSAEALKNIAKLVGNSEVRLSSYTAPEQAKAKDLEALPVASMLSHGGRIIIAVPKGKGEELVNALAGEAKLNKRLTSTHDIKVNSQGNFKEVNGQLVGLKNIISKGNKNRGMDINVGGYGQKDIHGQTIGDEKGATGANGHILFFTKSKDNLDFVQLGIEGSAPGKNGAYGFHGLGQKNDLSAFGTVKMHELDKKFDNEKYIIPEEKSMSIKLDEKECNKIIALIKSPNTPVPYDQPVKLKGGVESYAIKNGNDKGPNQALTDTTVVSDNDKGVAPKSAGKTSKNKSLVSAVSDAKGPSQALRDITAALTNHNMTVTPIAEGKTSKIKPPIATAFSNATVPDQPQR
jgi:hypothetical protein